MYEYKAKVISVYDGDTIRCDIDLGFDICIRYQAIRLLGIDTPEIRGDERENGLLVRDFVREEILDKEVILKTYKDRKGKYGRWLGEILYVKDDNTLNLCEVLLEKGYAVPYEWNR